MKQKEREKRRKKLLISGHLVLLQRTQAARVNKLLVDTEEKIFNNLVCFHKFVCTDAAISDLQNDIIIYFIF